MDSNPIVDKLRGIAVLDGVNLMRCAARSDGHIQLTCNSAAITILQQEIELERLKHEVAKLALESIEREKALTKILAEAEFWAQAEKDGRLSIN